MSRIFFSGCTLSRSPVCDPAAPNSAIALVIGGKSVLDVPLALQGQEFIDGLLVALKRCLHPFFQTGFIYNPVPFRIPGMADLRFCCRYGLTHKFTSDVRFRVADFDQGDSL